jgi:hypothetical protein
MVSLVRFDSNLESSVLTSAAFERTLMIFCGLSKNEHATILINLLIPPALSLELIY